MKIDRRLGEYILVRIASGEYPVGGKIPSLRRLAGKFAMPHSTVHLQLRPLLASGILRADGNRGLRVGSTRLFPSDGMPRKIAALIEPAVLGEPTSISYVALLAFQQLALASGFGLEIAPVAYDRLTAGLFRQTTAGCCAAALFKEYDTALSSFDSELPTVATLLADSYGGRISLVNLDEFQAAELAAAYFRERGVNRVEVIAHASPVYRRRGEIFLLKWRQDGGEGELFVTPQIQTRLYPGTGYLFASDTMLRRYYLEYQARCGRRLDEDFTILGIDGKRRLNPDWPLFPSIAVDWREIGESMFRELLRRLESPGRGGRRILLGGELFLIDGGSEIPAPAAFAAAGCGPERRNNDFDPALITFGGGENGGGK